MQCSWYKEGREAANAQQLPDAGRTTWIRHALQSTAQLLHHELLSLPASAAPENPASNAQTTCQ
jgi:hypothetical protein